jgi:ABC-type hemin transport system ATPase subunit
MPILPAILSWAAQRPYWQQDALRRLVEQSDLSSTDLAELTALCKAEVGLDVPGVGEWRPLGETVPGEESSDTAAVRLTSVRGVRNVNALADATELTFGRTGLSIIFGPNGSGKSGYVRLLKQVCRTRGARDAVHPNIYEAREEPLEATICYEVHEQPDATEARELVWTPGTAGNGELAKVSVLDTRAAAVYVAQNQEVAYLPHGMDLFPKLVRVMEQVKAQLEAEMTRLGEARDSFSEVPDSSVRNDLSAIGPRSTIEAFEHAAEVSDDDVERLRLLREDLARITGQDPARRATELAAQASRLTALGERLQAAELRLAEAVTELPAARATKEATQIAAQQAADRAFGDAPLGGVGTTPWMVLWEAARAFAATGATPTQDFPPSAEDAACVLCQQPVGLDGRERMNRFDQFVRERAASVAAEASATFSKRLQDLERFPCATISDAAGLQEVETLDLELAVLLRGRMAACLQLQADLLAAASALEDPAWPAPLPASDVSDRLTERIAAIRGEADQFRTAADPQARTATERTIREFEARLMLRELLPRVREQIARERTQALLRKALATTATSSVTTKNTELLREAVSGPLADAFEAQLKAFRLTHVPVAIRPAPGEKGRAYHALEFTAAASRAPKQEVLSEGEHRAIALAAFLAELSLQESASTVVLDDPVSSMDHDRREYVATQVVALSERRPVVVFTHDLVFLTMLLGAAAAAGIEVHHQQLRRTSSAAGLVSADVPWDGQNVRARSRALKNMIAPFRKLEETDPAQYEVQVRMFYPKLRQCWERGVEEVLFYNAVQRFSRAVQTERLKNLHRVTEDHCRTLRDGMTKTSTWTGHDHAAALALPLPTAAEVEADLQMFIDWEQSVRKAHEG